MRELGVLTAFVALVGGLLGLVLASEATIGVAVLAFCCLLAVIARMAQASAQHREIERLLEARNEVLRQP